MNRAEQNKPSMDNDTITEIDNEKEEKKSLNIVLKFKLTGYKV